MPEQTEMGIKDALMAEFSDPTEPEPEAEQMPGVQATLGRAFEALKRDDKQGFEKALSAAIDIKIMQTDMME